jgi:hypothetical protein
MATRLPCWLSNAVTSQVIKEPKTDLNVGLALSFRTRCHSELVGLGGLEPPTSPLSGVRSNHLSYRPGVASLESPHTEVRAFAEGSAHVGGASRDRTDDPLLAKQVLSQLSYGPKKTWVTDRAVARCSLNAGDLCGCLTGQSVIL